MSKAGLIIGREYWTRVKKRSFILITFLTPLFFAALFVVPILLTLWGGEEKNIMVVDESGFFNELSDTEELKFQQSPSAILEKKDDILSESGNMILHIPEFELYEPREFELYSDKSPGLGTVQNISSQLEERLKELRLQASNIDKETLESLEANVDIKSIIYSEGESREGNTGATTVVSWIGGFLIYMFIFYFGGQVTSGVHEEKSTRIVEIIISSVKPFQMMMGKIVGIALVGLTQFVMWVILTFILIGIASAIMGPEILSNAPAASQGMPADVGPEQSEMISSVMSAIGTINFPLLIGSFIFYFLSGYLLYSSLFAAIAAAVDNQTDMRQMIFPLSIPLIFGLILNQAILNNPDSGLAFWMSMIPLTSPVVMMARIPFGVPGWELALSMVLMILGFIGAVWIAGKIYRTGILMYGKKINFKDLFKWLSLKS